MFRGSTWRAPSAALFLVVTRLLSVLAHHALPAASGGRLTGEPGKLLIIALCTELGFLLLVFGVGAWVLRSVRPERRRAWIASGLALLALYLLVSEIDAHVRRWLGLRLNVVLLRHFFGAASELGFWRTLIGFLARDALAVGLSVLFLLVGWIAMALSLRRRRATPARGLCPVLVLVAAALFSASAPLVPAVRKWALAAPVPFVLARDLFRELRAGQQAPSAADLATFRAFIGNPEGELAAPAWRKPAPPTRPTTGGAPPGEPWDVILVAIESLRGWYADFRSPRMAERMPHLHALFREQGTAFVHSHSNGFPSGEGNVNLHLGVWSHPWRTTAHDHVAVRTRSLPELLGEAGYHRVWLTGSDPTYDNLQNFIGRWFDHWELVVWGDGVLVKRLLELYDASPPGKPRFFSLYTVSTHPPYHLPPEEGELPADPEAAYLRALRYADRKLGEVVAHVRAAGRGDRTLFVFTGDHAQPSDRQLAGDADVGLPNAGRTWTGLLFAAPGLAGGTIRTDSASHVDVAPTVLGLLGIARENHFLGRDLFRDPPRPAVAVLSGGLSLIHDDTMLVGSCESDQPVVKLRYDEGPLDDPGACGHGAVLQPSSADLEAFARARTAVAAYAWLIDHDRLAPGPSSE